MVKFQVPDEALSSRLPQCDYTADIVRSATSSSRYSWSPHPAHQFVDAATVMVEVQIVAVAVLSRVNRSKGSQASFVLLTG